MSENWKRNLILMGGICFLSIFLFLVSCSLFEPDSNYITSPQDKQTVRGVQSVVVTPPEKFNTDYVDISIDGSLADHATTAPYKYEWDTRSVTNGAHNIYAGLYSVEGSMLTDQITVYVDNK